MQVLICAYIHRHTVEQSNGALTHTNDTSRQTHSTESTVAMSENN